MAGHKHDTNPDIGAAFAGLIGGMIFLGAILYGVVLWTNKKFEGHGAEKKAAIAVEAPART